jgi:hypothetical protein
MTHGGILQRYRKLMRTTTLVLLSIGFFPHFAGVNLQLRTASIASLSTSDPPDLITTGSCTLPFLSMLISKRVSAFFGPCPAQLCGG